ALEYEYEPEMEDTYRSSMLKTFKKTLDDGFFPFIILDTINDRVKHFEQFWSAAKTKGFEMSNNWESSPRHMVRLDVRSLLQDAAIEEVTCFFFYGFVLLRVKTLLICQCLS
ncbi:YLP motif-containing protein 1, partial [Xenoophorus captivus]